MSETSRKTQIYAIDFDGTIAQTKWPDIIGPNRPVVDFIKRLHARGDQWILWTNRDGENLDMALDWCREQGIVPDAVNDNLPHLKEFFGNNPRKVFANFYIDDHNAGGVMLPADDDVAPGAGQEKGEDPSNRSVRRFTPGPWTFDDTDESFGRPAIIAKGAERYSKFGPVCLVMKRHPNYRANASAIVKVPDMIEFICDLVSACDYGTEYLSPSFRARAEKLISKIMGEKQ